MSTKIYDAFRIKTEGDPWAVIWRIEQQAKENVKSVLKELSFRLMTEARTDPEAFIKKFETNEKRDLYDFLKGNRSTWDFWNFAYNSMCRAYRAQVVKSAWSPWNFDVSIQICPLEHELYVKFYAEGFMREVFAFTQTDPEIVDFHFQDQAEKPPKISKREWKHREVTWNRMLKEDGTLRHVHLDICSHSNLWLLSPLLDPVPFNRELKVWEETQLQKGLAKRPLQTPSQGSRSPKKRRKVS